LQRLAHLHKKNPYADVGSGHPHEMFQLSRLALWLARGELVSGKRKGLREKRAFSRLPPCFCRAQGCSRVSVTANERKWVILRAPRTPRVAQRTHSFFPRDFPGGFINILLVLSIERSPATHPTSLRNRSRHSGQRLTCLSTCCSSRLESSCHDMPFQQFSGQVLRLLHS